VFPFCGSYLRISVFVFFSAGGYEWSTLLGFIFYNIYFIQYFVQKFFTNFFELTVKCIVEIIQKILLTFIFSSYMICWFFFFVSIKIINMRMVCMRMCGGCVCLMGDGCVFWGDFPDLEFRGTNTKLLMPRVGGVWVGCGGCSGGVDVTLTFRLRISWIKGYEVRTKSI